MRVYRVIIRADKWPEEFAVNASNFGTAVSRAIKEWKKRFKGAKVNELNIRVLKGGELLIANEKND